MKTMLKMMLSVLTAVCLLAVPCVGMFVHAASVDLMPVADAEYTIVLGDGTVELTDGKMILVNNGDGDFRVTINTKATFDLAAAPYLHMQFAADMPFKMAYHVTNVDASEGNWMTTSTNFGDTYVVDTASDRAQPGDYDVKMNLNELSTVSDRSAMCFEQFIILVTGKGTFTLDLVAMTDGEEETVTTTTVTEDETTTTAGEDETSTTVTEDETTTTTKTTVADEKAPDEEPPQTGEHSQVMTVAVVAAAAAIVVALAIISKKSASR